MDNNTSTPSNPKPYDGLNMNIPEPESAIADPQNNAEVFYGSFAGMLRDNLGAYVVCEFLIGTDTLVAKEGILYNAGNNFITLYNEENDYYTVCDMYSLKFVNFFDPRSLEQNHGKLINLVDTIPELRSNRNDPVLYEGGRPAPQPNRNEFYNTAR